MFLSQSLLNRDLGEHRRATIPNTRYFVLFRFVLLVILGPSHKLLVGINMLWDCMQ